MSTETQTAEKVLETHVGHAPPALQQNPSPAQHQTEEQQPQPPREKMTLSTRLTPKKSGGLLLLPQTFGEALEMAKAMSKAEGAVGVHLLGNPGGCLMIVLLGIEVGMSPFAVARHSYVAQKVKPNEPIGQISFEAQFYMAVANKLAPIKEGRLKHRFSGSGDALRCTVYATFKGDDEPTELESETLKDLRPGSNGDGDVKGSPLWRKKPKQQMIYNTARDWVRAHCPEIMLGVYTQDELMDFAEAFAGGEAPKKIDPFSGPAPKPQLPKPDDASDKVREALEPLASRDQSDASPIADASSSPSEASVNSEAREETPASDLSSQSSGLADQPDEAGAPDMSSVGAPATQTTPEEARAAGASAKAAGDDESTNPHEENSELWVAWIEGYHDDKPPRRGRKRCS